MRYAILCFVIFATAVLKVPAQESKEFFAPKKVRLKFVDAPPADVIRELSKQSGYPLGMEKYQALPVEPLLTIDTGETTFWQAFDELCAKAQLTLSDIHFGGATNVAQVLPPEQFAKYQAVTKRTLANDMVLAKLKPASPAYQAALALHPRLLVEEASVLAQIREPLVRKPSVLLLRKAPPEKAPTTYAGSFRYRVVVCETGTQLDLPQEFAGELIVVVEVTAEPRFQDLVIREVKISKSDFPRVLEGLSKGGRKPPLLEAFWIRDRRNFALQHDTAIQRHLYFRFASGEKVTELRELAVNLNAEVFSQLPERALKNPLQAAGKSIDLGKWGTLEIKSVEKQNEGYRVRYTNKYGKHVTLLDDKNQAYARRYPKDLSRESADILFVPQLGQGEPDRLVVFEPETKTFEMEFRFENIPAKKLLDRKSR